MTKKIVFDLEEFETFLENLEEVEQNTGCRKSYDYERITYYIDEDGYIKVRRILYWEGSLTKNDDNIINIDDNYYDDMTIKGEILPDYLDVNIGEKNDNKEKYRN